MKKDNKKALYESIMTSVAKEVKKALNEASYDDVDNEVWDDDDEDWDDNEYEGEAITYNDIIDVVEGENYQEIIDEEGEAWGERVLDYIKCPVNGAGVYDACVEIAERLLNGEDPDDLRAEIGEDEI